MVVQMVVALAALPVRPPVCPEPMPATEAVAALGVLPALQRLRGMQTSVVLLVAVAAGAGLLTAAADVADAAASAAAVAAATGHGN